MSTSLEQLAVLCLIHHGTQWAHVSSQNTLVTLVAEQSGLRAADQQATIQPSHSGVETSMQDYLKSKDRQAPARKGSGLKASGAQQGFTTDRSLPSLQRLGLPNTGVHTHLQLTLQQTSISHPITLEPD